MASPPCSRQALSRLIQQTFERCSPRSNLPPTLSQCRRRNFGAAQTQRINNSTNHRGAIENVSTSSPSEDDTFVPFGEASASASASLSVSPSASPSGGTNITSLFPTASAVSQPNTDNIPPRFPEQATTPRIEQGDFIPAIQLRESQRNKPKKRPRDRDGDRDSAPRQSQPKASSPTTTTRAYTATSKGTKQSSTTSASATISKDTKQTTTTTNTPSKDDNQTPPLRPREPWQIQKAALRAKFGSAPWSPAKRLSPDALEGIRALHAQYPTHFTTEVLAARFAVSPEAVRRILKSKWRANPVEEEERRERWERRGERAWREMVEKKGVHPPRKWREKGIGVDVPRRPSGRQWDEILARGREARMERERGGGAASGDGDGGAVGGRRWPMPASKSASAAASY